MMYGETTFLSMLTISVLAVCYLSSPAPGQPLSIYDIQYTTDPAGDSPQAGNTVDCLGGIVTHKFRGGKPKLTLYSPDFSLGWGGIQVKDFTTNLDLFDAVAVGDWISLSGVLVEESRGSTLLLFDTASGFTVESPGNSLPTPIPVAPSDIAAPIQNTDPSDLGWYVADHSAEKYEAMWVQVQNVTVGAMGLGKAGDNYELTDAGGTCWAADYMNADATGLYHPYVATGRTFNSVTGIVEQYTNLSSGWDYYQLLTTSTADIVPEPSMCILLALGGMVTVSYRRRCG
jgi:hypothetical protein